MIIPPVKLRGPNKPLKPLKKQKKNQSHKNCIVLLFQKFSLTFYLIGSKWLFSQSNFMLSSKMLNLFIILFLPTLVSDQSMSPKDKKSGNNTLPFF